MNKVATAEPRLVTLAEVKQLLETEQAGREELSYEQKLALDHALHFVHVTPKKAAEVAKRIGQLGGRVTTYYAYRIADLMPADADGVRAIFAKERSTPDDAEIEKILAIVQEYL